MPEEKEATPHNDAETAYARVMDAIVTQELAPSQKISENILIDMFDMSRFVARNLIERLTAEHFLVSVSQRVTQVASLTLLDIKQNFILRKTLLPEIISLGAAKVDYEKIEKLNENVLSMLPSKDDQVALQVLKMNKQLNLTLCEGAGYPLMLEWVRQLEDTAMRIYWLYVKSNKDFPYSNDQHAVIFNVLKSDEPTKIRSTVSEIISQSEERILNLVFTNEQFFTQNLRA